MQRIAVEMVGDREAQSAAEAEVRNEARPASLPIGKKRREPSLGARPLLPPIPDSSSTPEVCFWALLLFFCVCVLNGATLLPLPTPLGPGVGSFDLHTILLVLLFKLLLK